MFRWKSLLKSCWKLAGVERIFSYFYLCSVSLKIITEQSFFLQNVYNQVLEIFISNHQKMFDEEDYYSDQEQNVMTSNKNMASSKVLVPSSGSGFNHLAGQGQSLMKIMKQRGLDLSENEVKKYKQPKSKQKPQQKSKPKTGFFDGGDKASVQQLIKALNKSFSSADPQQASCILSYILEKKNLSSELRNKFSIMKCNILFGLGAFQECLSKAQQFLQKSENKLSSAIYSNLMAKCKIQNENILSGYIDFLRSRSLIQQFRQQQQATEIQKKNEMSEKTEQKAKQQQKQQYAESEIDVTARQINHTELEYNIKMGKYKNNTNLIYPYYPQFRHRKILKVVCGDYHSLFLVGDSLSKNFGKQNQNPLWATQVFGVGENTVGQITGKERKVIYKQPILISQLSGKQIQGVWACRQSSLAYDRNGNIYEWGIKQKRNQSIQITYTVGQQILKFEKGYKHYALLTKSNKFYSWGSIQMKGAIILNQSKPTAQQAKNVIDFSCGNSHIIAVNSAGQAYALGSNDLFQLGMPAEKACKAFKKVDTDMIGSIKKAFCISDCTLLVSQENQVFYVGRHSLKKQPQQRFRQAEFGEDFQDIIAITGSVGLYYVTNELGVCYKWDVDNMVKFRVDRDNQQIAQRYVQASRGTIFKVRSMINPDFCKIKRSTQELKTYQTIEYQMTLKDEYGLYGVSDFIIPPKCQVFLSTYRAKKQDIISQNKSFLQSHNFCLTSNKLLINEIIQNRLLSFQLNRDEQKPWIAQLKISVQASGRYYFYVLIEQTLLLQEQLQISISDREKELQQKNKQDRLLKQQQRKRKAQLQKQRLAEQKMKKQQEEEERRKQTQRRAEQALKKHMRQQQQAKSRQQQQRKARKQLMTGGGFDLSKLKKKASVELVTQEKPQKIERIQRLQKTTGESFLPDINLRPSSRKKNTLPKPSQLITSLNKQKPQPLLKASISDFSSTGFSVTNPVNQRPSTPKKQPLSATMTAATNAIRTSQPKQGVVKRGLSKKKN